MRENSSWVTSAVMMRCLELLSRALQSMSAQLQIVLLLDTARAHLGLEVARWAAELDIWLVIIPAGLTWLLQPLDVCIFASFKRHLKEQYSRKRSGKVTATDWLQLVISAASWLGARRSAAFQLTGITGRERLHRELRLIWSATLARAPGCPIDLEARRLWPSNSKNIPWWHLLRGPGRFGRTIRIAQHVGPSGLVAMVIHDIQQHYVLGLLPRYMQLSDNLLGIV
jgi:hypothetical protein